MSSVLLSSLSRCATLPPPTSSTAYARWCRRSFIAAPTHQRGVLRALIMGPPGSGKGTQGGWIVRDFSVPKLSTGELLREEIALRSALGQRAESAMARGELVGDDDVTSLLSKHLDVCVGGWLLDGYPRTLEQARTLERTLATIDQRLTLAVHIDVGDDAIVERIAQRWVHAPSGRTYNLAFAAERPRVDGRDDDTGEPLVQRDDDREATVRARLRVYHEHTKPVLEFYRERGVLVDVPSPTSSEGYALTRAAIERALANGEQQH